MSETPPPLGGIHEAALYTRDLEAAERFWLRLGFERVGPADSAHRFFRAGRDVLLVFDPTSTLFAGREIPTHGALGPGHVAFDVPGPDALAAWRRRLERAGIEVETEHAWPHGGRSIYFRDPDGNSIEFITRGSWGG